MLLTIFLVLPALPSIPKAHALPSRAIYQPLSGSANSTVNPILPLCFSPLSHPGIQRVNAADCNRALRRIILEPRFTTPFRFSKNPRREDVIKLPVGWMAGNCVIFVSCSNTQDTDVFRYADVARAVKNTIELCVDVDDPSDPDDKPYGGLEPVGSVGTFYISVNSPRNPRVAAASPRAKNITMS